MKSLFPSRKQWDNWSLPSKLTAVGAYVGIISFVIALVSIASSIRTQTNNAQNQIATNTLSPSLPATQTPIPILTTASTSVSLSTLTEAPSHTPTNTSTGTPSPSLPIATTNYTPTPTSTVTPIRTFLVDGFETYNNSSLSEGFRINIDAGNSGSLRLVGVPHVDEGRQAIAFDYIIHDPVADHYYIGFERDFPAQDWSGFSLLCLWVEVDGSNRDFVVQIRDTNEEFFKQTTSLGIIGTGDYCMSLDASNVNFSSISNYAIYVEGPPADSSVIYIDNIRLTTE